MEPPDLKVVLASASVLRFVRNSTITYEGAPAERLFVLVRGRARYFTITPDGRKVILFWLIPGDMFGGNTLISTPSEYLLSTESVKDSTVLMWNRETIRSLAHRYPHLMENGLSTASDYLAWYAASHLALSFTDARSRLANVLINLVKGIGRERSGRKELAITNEELAHAANLTIFTVSRLVNEWQRSGAIVKRRGHVLVHSSDKLLLGRKQTTLT
jgi:CRP-like cAMP-binding protein